MASVALLALGCEKKEVGDNKPAKEETPNKVPTREVSHDELEARDGVWYVKGETEPFSGTQIGYRKDGSQNLVTSFVNGLRHGMETGYHGDGSKMSERTYLNGKKHGTDTVWRVDGSKVREISYKNGEKHGAEALYNTDGLKWSEASYANGKKHGEHIQIIEDSEIYEKQVFRYQNGKLHGMAVGYNKDGSMKWETFWENGKNISTKRFKKPPPHHKVSEVRADQLEERRGVWYAKGKPERFNGTSISYYPDGSRNSEYPYVNGKKHGIATWYNEDGSKRSEISHVDGKKHGKWIMYRRDGSRSSETVYENNKRISKKE